MSSWDVALKYMDIFYSGRDLERFREVLATDCTFKGPWYSCDSAQAYVNSLLADPPVRCTFKVGKLFEQGPSVNLICEFSKHNILTVMSQYSEVQNEKITNILLIFDTGAFILRSSLWVLPSPATIR